MGFIDGGALTRYLIKSRGYIVTDDDIDSAPRIDDVEVVRCRDCRWYDKGENEVDSWEYCTRIGHHPQSDGFCAWGERMQEDGNGEEG